MPLGYASIGIHSNHMEMTKFANVDDPDFVDICGELHRWIRNTDANKRRHTSSSLAEGPSLANQFSVCEKQVNWNCESKEKKKNSVCDLSDPSDTSDIESIFSIKTISSSQTS